MKTPAWGGEEHDSERWQELLEEIGTGRAEMVLTTRDGARVALIAESRLADLRRPSAERSQPPVRSLTSRELQVLRLAATGMPGTAIATSLGIAVNTVAQHLVSVRSKLDVRTTTEAVAASRRHGLLEG